MRGDDRCESSAHASAVQASGEAGDHRRDYADDAQPFRISQLIYDKRYRAYTLQIITIFLFMLAVLFINPVTRLGEVNLKAEVIIKLTYSWVS